MPTQYLFYATILSVFLLLHVYLGRRLIGPTGWPRRKRLLGWLGIIALYAFQLVANLLYRTNTSEVIPAWLTVTMWALYITTGMVAMTLLLFIFRDIVRLLYWIQRKLSGLWASKPTQDGESGPARVDLSRRRFLSNGVNLGIVGFSVGLSGAGLHGANSRPKVEVVEVRLPDLHPDMDGYRIVHLTDMHIGPTLRRDFVAQVVTDTMAQRPDLIVMTGDMIDGTVEQLRRELEPLTTLSAPGGKFWTTGNHEYYWNAPSWIDEAARMGFTVLRNEHRVLSRGAGKLVLAGVNDLQAGRFSPNEASSPEKAMRNAPRDCPSVLLAHQPKSCFAAAKAGIDLQLSGHTHGGQFIPWNFFVRLDQPFIAGLGRYENTQVYTSRGVGYWGPPLRLGVPSEIAVIVLRRGEASVG